MHKVMFLFFIISFSINISANESLSSLCSEENHINTITRPISTTNMNLGTFEYKYRYLRSKNSTAPVIIFLPGGPGQSSISLDDPRHNDSHGFIQTDPRGVKCNRFFGKIPDSAINTQTLSLDIIEIIKELNLKNYILYGVSYGTVLATKVAFEIEQLNIAAPKAIVLEGVVGKAESHLQIEKNYSRRWEEVKKHLNSTSLNILSNVKLPFGIDSTRWALFIKSLLNFGKTPNNDISLKSLLNLLSSSKEQQDILKKLVKDLSQGPNEDEYRLYKLIACSEIYDKDFATILENGYLVRDFSKDDNCADVPFSQPVDVANWPIRSKIYYFSGTKDVATPIKWARYHFNKQIISLKRIFITVKDGGHNPLKVNLSDCKSNIWGSILENSDIFKALNTCILQTEIKIM